MLSCCRKPRPHNGVRVSQVTLPGGNTQYLKQIKFNGCPNSFRKCIDIEKLIFVASLGFRID